MRYDAKQVIFDEAYLKEEEVLFTDLRVDRTTIPEGFWIFELRHADDNWGEVCEVCERVLVNFFGTVIAKRDILEGQKEKYLPLEEGDFFFGDDCLTLDEWIFRLEEEQKKEKS